jgi:hypothetical protein
MLEFLKLQGLPSTSKFCYTLIYVSLPMQNAFEHNQIDITANTSSSSRHIRSHSFCLCLFMRFPAKFFFHVRVLMNAKERQYCFGSPSGRFLLRIKLITCYLREEQENSRMYPISVLIVPKPTATLRSRPKSSKTSSLRKLSHNGEANSAE